MRYLANENFPGPIVDSLRHDGHDVAWVAEDMRGASDAAVLARAQAERRTHHPASSLSSSALTAPM